MSRLLRLTAAAALATVLLTGCTSAPEAAPSTSPSAAPSAPATPEPLPVVSAAGDVATVTVAEIVVLDAPDGAEIARFGMQNANGVPTVFLVEEEQDGWLRVQLPIRPNGTSGWIRAAEVSLATQQYSLVVSTADRTVTLLQDDVVQQVFPAAVGTGDTPTPVGSFFLTELLAPTNQGYGPYAYGISAFSDVLNSFGGGPGQIGIHGTDDSNSIGQAASHGCIRLSNEDITLLAGILPLGTPVTIT